MRRISRSSHLAFSECTRKGYWGYVYKGTGLDEPRSIALNVGLAVHAGMETLMKGKTDDTALMDSVEAEWVSLGMPMTEFRDEQHVALAKALVLGWKRSRYDEFMEKYDVVLVEEEMEVMLAPNIILQARADCVTRSKWDGTLLVWNWKTTGSMRDWNGQWQFDIQAMTEALSVQEHLGEYVQGCVFEGFFKAGVYGGVSSSPLVTGYTDGTIWEVGGKSRSKEWQKLSTWKEFPGGTPLWLDFIGTAASDQFVRSAIILKNDEAVREWLPEVVRFESDVDRMMDDSVPESDRHTFFRKNAGRRCNWCRFAPACWSGMPVDALDLPVREDHHGGGKKVVVSGGSQPHCSGADPQDSGGSSK